MFTIEDLKKKIDIIKKENAEKTLEIQRNEAKISVYEDIIKEVESQNKPLNEEDMIRVATQMIKVNPNMQRVKAIANKLREEPIDFDANLLGTMLENTGKFKINAETKYWEIIE